MFRFGRLHNVFLLGVTAVATLFLCTRCFSQQEDDAAAADDSSIAYDSNELKSAVFAGGCFWCSESDFEHLPGVKRVIAGYTGGRTKNPTYANYKTGGHREAVFVIYDPATITFAGLVEYFLKHIDPTDSYGQFQDRGQHYSPAIYYETNEEKATALKVMQALERSGVFGKKRFQVDVESRKPFWPAEEYHQDYYRKNALKYQAYRLASGRDAFISKHWGARATILELPESLPAEAQDRQSVEERLRRARMKWSNFKKPSPLELKKQLTPMQYKVTQENGTEPAFHNKYWDNKEEGIYVDIVSGEPLFCSLDKYESGTGWPSFVKPITPDAVVYRMERNLFVVRTEVRSRFADSHLGHVFNDGPPDRGGKRYCMNSAALRFIPKDRMEQEGYGEFLILFENDGNDQREQVISSTASSQ